ncbi:aminotransferase-like domain-containing protein [Acuticoccus mangrovi]|uniref:PLP-dependent aminotransferase family protein n=1 Tax=Acuticoccus mangrovi TaxID=2796142 RepID=A0A934ISH4_9HYPH|nr:PLP-dependent aminotransferase family protein [Acuticoccus mangrovi]MBJ3777966.1 PLP-dependent aminotransferase family protein [Acuticoccus mangrovi]
MTGYRFSLRSDQTAGYEHPPAVRDAIKLSGGSAFGPTMPDVVQAAMTAAGEYRTEVMQYGPLMGLPDLREALAAFERKDGVDCTADNILVTSGAKQAIELICRTFLDEGDLMVVSAPTYVTAIPIFVGAGARFMNIGQDADGMNVPELAEKLAALHRDGMRMPKLIYDIPDHHNPAGLVLSLERRHQMLELARTYNIVIIEDQTYRHIRFEGEALPSIRSLDDGTHVLPVNTLSKLLAPGMRLGWTVAPTALLPRLANFKAEGGTSPFLQRVAVEVLRHGGVEEHLSLVIPELGRHRDAMLAALAKELPEAHVTVPKGGFFLWVSFDGVDADDVYGAGLRHGVVTYPGSICFASEPDRSHLRLSYSQASPEQIEEGIRRLAAAYRDVAFSNRKHVVA